MSARVVEREAVPVEGVRWTTSVWVDGTFVPLADTLLTLPRVEQAARDDAKWFARASTDAALREARGVA